MIRRPPRSPLFPYPTLSRSLGRRRRHLERSASRHPARPELRPGVGARRGPARRGVRRVRERRSEEHTSELQSLAYLVCRLLLEKKKKQIDVSTITTAKRD